MNSHQTTNLKVTQPIKLVHNDKKKQQKGGNDPTN